MERILCLIAALVLPVFFIRADDGTTPLFFNGVDVKDARCLYEKLTGRKVWVTLDLRAELVFWAKGPIPKAEAIRLFRTTLLERYGIEIRDVGDKEAFVTWSDDPKYKAIGEAVKKHPFDERPVSDPTKPRVRIIEPKEPQK